MIAASQPRLWPGPRGAKLESPLSIMERFLVHPFLSITSLAGRYPSLGDSHVIDRQEKDTALALIEKHREACAKMGLVASTATLDRLIDLLMRDELVQRGEVSRLLEELDGRMRDEMTFSTLFSLNLQEAEWYLLPLKGWEAIAERFPGALSDIEEGTKCLALGRYTACVFHLMRTVEAGLRSLGNALDDPALDPAKNPAWEAILKKCDRELQKPHAERSPEWRTDELFFSTATANLRAVKDAWRNPALHVGQLYSEEVTRDIYSAVRSFMRHLATKLSEA